jgi:hypothetical protein
MWTAMGALALCAAAALTQDSVTASKPDVSVITFDLFWDAATPQKFTITVDSSGRAKYVSHNETKEPDPARRESMVQGDPDYEVEFAMSAANRNRVFQLARDANYFNGKFDYTAHRIANTGRKTLTYHGAGQNFETSYNWSENKSIDQLTRLFEGISNTVEHGRKLQFLRRFDKLGLEKELKGMEQLAANNELAEIQIIAAVLENIANDFSVLNIARQRARHLLALNPS